MQCTRQAHLDVVLLHVVLEISPLLIGIGEAMMKLAYQQFSHDRKVISIFSLNSR